MHLIPNIVSPTDIPFQVAPGPYSPPEVWPPVVWPSEPSEQDLRSVDSWACGCVLVYIHTGHHLIDPTREMESMESIKAMKDSGAHLSLPVVRFLIVPFQHSVFC